MKSSSLMNIRMTAAEVSGSLSNDAFPGSKFDNSTMLESLVWLIVALAVVVIMIVVLIRWLSRRNRSWSGRKQTIQTLGGTALGQQSSLQVVELAGRLYVLGVHQNGVQLIDKIDNPDDVMAIMDSFDQQHDMKNLTTPINQWMNQWKAKRTKAGTTGEAGANPEQQNQSVTEFEMLLQKQLQERKIRNEQLKQLMNESKSNERLMDDEK